MHFRLFQSALLAVAALPALAGEPLLLPQPKHYEATGGSLRGGTPRVVWQPMTHAEEYRLEVSRRGGIVITTADSAGLRAARATLAQLTRRGRTPCCRIGDWPDVAWRGLMIDVSRHLFPMSFLQQQVDHLAALKMNRLHLHLTDAGGWRMQMRSRPRLTSLAAWRTQSDWQRWWSDGDRRYCAEGTPGAYGGYYTQAELRELVAYAARRGVTVVPEVELPGHSDEVLAAYPELGCTDSLGHPLAGQSDLCPSAPATAQFVADVLGEVADVFPSEYIHVGGDEAGMAAWRTCPRCRAKLRQLGSDDPHRLLTYLMDHARAVLAARGRRLIAWDEALGEGLPSEATIQVWRGGDAPQRAAARGCAVILSPTAHCYLNDHQNAPGTERLKGGLSFLPLSRVYAFAPRQMAGEARLLGIEACLWTEYIETPAEAQYQLYPRLLALAEVGWNAERRAPYDVFRRRAQAMCRELRAAGLAPFDLRRERPARRESLQPADHKARGCRVTYNVPYSRYFAAAGEATLTDGLQGGWYYADGRWQGFGSRGLDVTIDLGRPTAIRNVALTFVVAPQAEVVLPRQLVIVCSDDGRTFAPLSVLMPKAPTDSLPTLQRLQWRGRAHTRYLRLVAPGSGGWLFTDEVIVR